MAVQCMPGSTTVVKSKFHLNPPVALYICVNISWAREKVQSRSQSKSSYIKGIQFKNVFLCTELLYERWKVYKVAFMLSLTLNKEDVMFRKLRTYCKNYTCPHTYNYAQLNTEHQSTNCREGLVVTVCVHVFTVCVYMYVCVCVIYTLEDYSVYAPCRM